MSEFYKCHNCDGKGEVEIEFLDESVGKQTRLTCCLVCSGVGWLDWVSNAMPYNVTYTSSGLPTTESYTNCLERLRKIEGQDE